MILPQTARPEKVVSGHLRGWKNCGKRCMALQRHVAKSQVEGGKDDALPKTAFSPSAPLMISDRALPSHLIAGG
jgi:hypothetical protein